VAANARSTRDERRRRLGQNFLRPAVGRQLVEAAGFRAGELVLEIGAGCGAFTLALARAPIELIAVELDPIWADRLRGELTRQGAHHVRVVCADFFALDLPARPFRVIGSLPFARTTDVCRRLFDDPSLPLQRADLVVQWEVARKRAEHPPASLLSSAWAPWWEFRLGRRIDAREFRPVPRTDAGLLVATRRSPALLAPRLAAAWSSCLRSHWQNGDVRLRN
jgi:23S rRNA (adenine-N6)-dimethyltransferase